MINHCFQGWVQIEASDSPGIILHGDFCCVSSGDCHALLKMFFVIWVWVKLNHPTICWHCMYYPNCHRFFFGIDPIIYWGTHFWPIAFAIFPGAKRSQRSSAKFWTRELSGSCGAMKTWKRWPTSFEARQPRCFVGGIGDGSLNRPGPLVNGRYPLVMTNIAIENDHL